MSIDAKKVESEKATKGMAEFREKLHLEKDEHKETTKDDYNYEDVKLYHATQRFAREGYHRKSRMRWQKIGKRESKGRNENN